MDASGSGREDKMNRRNFLSSLSAAVTGAVLDEDRILWIPGKTTYSIPLPTPKTGVFKLNFHGIPYRVIDFSERLDNIWREYPGHKLFEIDGVRVFEEWSEAGSLTSRYGHAISSYMVPIGFKGDLSKISQVVDVDISDMAGARQWRHDPISGLMVKNV